MNDVITLQQTTSGIQELSLDEVSYVSGAGFKEGAAAIGAAAGIGAATFGGTWGVVAVGAAFGAAPFAVAGMAVLTVVGAYHLWRSA